MLESEPNPQPAARTFKADLLASIVVFLVALPLCMGIAIASGAPVAAGLITGIIGGLVVGSLAGCPLQVSGPAAGLTVIVYEIIREFGLEMLGIVVFMAGALQLLAGVLKLGQWFRAVSPAVIHGMLAGIGILIFASQFHVMVDDKPKGTGWENLRTIPAAIAKAFDWQSLGTPSEREFNTTALRRIGELHRRQLVVAEHVAEQLPDHSTPEQLAAETPTQIASEAAALAELLPEQEQLTLDLQQFQTELSQLVEQNPDNQRTPVILAAVTGSVERSLAAAIDLRQGEVRHATASQNAAAQSLEQISGQLKNHSVAAQLGILTIILILLWQGLTPARLRIIPAPLIAVTCATLVAGLLTLPVLYVEVPSNLWEEVRLPLWSVLQDAPWLGLLKVGLVVAIVASAETLLCATAVDQMKPGQRTKYDQELSAQGVGNMLCGLLGALPMTGVIVRSSANIQAGGKTRLSAVLHGVWLLLFVALLAALLRLIPTSGLAAILVYTGYKLVNLKAIRRLLTFGWGEVAIYAATVITIVFFDLLSGVVLGVGLSAAMLLYRFSHLRARLSLKKDRAVLQLAGAATFLRLPQLASELEEIPPRSSVQIDVQQLEFIDHACIELLTNWTKQHQSTGGQVLLDWERLQACFREHPGDSPDSDNGFPAGAATGDDSHSVTAAAGRALSRK